MFISDFAIKRPIVTITAMIFLVVFGIYALIQLEVDEFPDLDNPIVAVSVPYPGAAPETVEREVVDRIEEAVSGINGIDRIQSTANDGFAQIIVFFTFDKGVEQASQDVRDAISSIRGDLPQEIEEPILRRFDPADFPIVTLTLSSPTMSQAELTQLADPMIKRELSALNGVATVNVVGGAERELTVELRPQDLASNGVGISQVVQALQSQNLAAPVGRVNGSITERTIRLQGRLDRPEDFLGLVVAERNGRVIRLGDVANVRDGTEEPRSMALFNGRPAVGIQVLMAKGKSTTTVADEVRKTVAELQKRLPAAARLDVVQDAGVRVRNSVRNVEEALIEGALLTILVVFLFLNSWRSTVITGLALPVSVLAAFIPVWLFGFSLNTMSLLGLSLAIGILIDDAIVVRENIVRHIEMGEDHYEASRKGTAQIGLAVAATTFSIVCVFVPVGFMYGVAGQWFKPFALTIAAAVLVSLFVSFSLDPMLSAYWADPQTEGHERKNPIARALDRFNVWFDGQADNYKRLIAWALDHRWSMIGIAGGTFVLAFVLQFMFGGGGFFPDSDNSELNVQIETPPGSNLDYTRLKTDEVARVIRAHPEVAYTFASVGAASGSGSVDQANLYVKLVPKNERSLHQSELAAELRQEMRRLGGVTAWIFSGGMGGAQKQIQVELRGPDATTLTALAERMAVEARKVPGAADVGLSTRGQKPELEIQVNRGVAGSLGVTTGQIAQSLRPAFAGIDAGDWVDPTGETRDVEVRLTPEARRRAADLRQLPLVLQGAGAGQAPSTIPLEQVATVRDGVGPAQIDHLDRDKVVTIGANVEGRDLSSVSREINEAVRRVPIPSGYRITQGGQVKDQAEVFGRIFAALAFAILLMYFILVVQFGSFLDPFAILLSLPLSLIGVVIALIITRDTLNIMSMIGVILLAGIVAKNAILLIDFAKWGMERGMSRRDALIEAGRIRLRPILMTTFALIAGMIPVALGLGEGADFRAPLGRAVIGGVITSTLLTLLVIPTVYEILDEWKEALVHRFTKRRAHAPAGEPEAVPAGD
ncbi:MAG TPA: efflux RND transporter permease subunit [Longimicrobiales bacterium]|nr:efflux RND transporter permease subunit [Longimicrobiales bacterium]